MVLFAAKVHASLRSGSLAIITSMLESLLDLLSGFILWFTAFSMQTPNPYEYPIEKKRTHPLSLKGLSEEIVETAETESGFTMFPMPMGLKGRFVCNPALNFLSCGFPSLEKDG
ncbi:PREDICTED: metal tolerance [Prunus dulcis]|uniref:PREDICTED: metal tolerance n=1 Tax=Prunus dulcis TaxID=3755 RepID=A0A5E4EF17_PRUDU|nr:PREDICTED: metal tolerance [Prunus dulcis]